MEKCGSKMRPTIKDKNIYWWAGDGWYYLYDGQLVGRYSSEQECRRERSYRVSVLSKPKRRP